MKCLLYLLFYIMPIIGWAQNADYAKEISKAEEFISNTKFDLALNTYSKILEYPSLRKEDLIDIKFKIAYLHFLINDRSKGYELMNIFLDSIFIKKKVSENFYTDINRQLLKGLDENIIDTTFIVNYLEKLITQIRVSIGVCNLYETSFERYLSLNKSLVRVSKFTIIEFEYLRHIKEYSNVETLLSNILMKIEDNNFYILEDNYHLSASNLIDYGYNISKECKFKYEFISFINYYKGLNYYKTGNFKLSLNLFIELKKSLEENNITSGIYLQTIFNILTLLESNNKTDSTSYYLKFAEKNITNGTQQQKDVFCTYKLTEILMYDNKFYRISQTVDSLEAIYGCSIDKSIIKYFATSIGDNNTFLKETDNTSYDQPKDIKENFNNIEIELLKLDNYYTRNDFKSAITCITSLYSALDYLDSIKYSKTNVFYYEALFKVNLYFIKIIEATYPNKPESIYKELVRLNVNVFDSIPGIPLEYMFYTYEYLSTITNKMENYVESLKYAERCLNIISSNSNSSYKFLTDKIEFLQADIMHNLGKMTNENYLKYIVGYYEKVGKFNLDPLRTSLIDILYNANATNNKLIFNKYLTDYLGLVKTGIINQWSFKAELEQQIDIKKLKSKLEEVLIYAKRLKINTDKINEICGELLMIRSLDIGNFAQIPNLKKYDVTTYSKITSLQDIFLLYSKMNSGDLKKANITDDSIRAINEEINFYITKLVQKTGIIRNEYGRYNIDSLRKYLNDDECFIFQYQESNPFKDDYLQNIEFIIFTKKDSTPIFITNSPLRQIKMLNNNMTKMQYAKWLENISYEELFLIQFHNLLKIVREFKTIYYSFSGDFNKFNFEQMFNPDTKSYLSDSFNFFNCPTLEYFYNIKQPKQNNYKNKNVVLFGNPDFNTTPSDLVQKLDRSAWDDISYYYIDSLKIKNKFNSLPNTKIEIDEISRICKSNNITSTMYQNDRCTETNFKRINSPYILHIATHGYYFQNTTNEYFNKYSSISNELLNTGLIFSEANNNISNNTNDGFLSAYEVFNLNLTGTELVVLSACETSLGSYNAAGNDLNSLQRAFQLAGAKAVLASKWKVPDKQTQELMVEFYTNWLEKKMTKHKALQQAQLTLSKKYPEPYCWAAWVLYGE